MVRAPCIDKNGVKRGAWSEEEDNKLRDYIERYGHWNWRELPKYAGLARCGKSCRLRWMNYLRPTVKRGNFSEEEEDLIIKLHQNIGNRWSVIAAQLPGRSDNEIKNHWHTHLKKRRDEHSHPIANKEISEENKIKIERIIDFSGMVSSSSSDNRISVESTTSQRVSDDSSSCPWVQNHRLLIDLNQEYVESWDEKDFMLKKQLEC
ncbi:hypothetical protein M8C21_030788 [Ambrosia artemisiifolia]|uniref:Uncharacterized protein n=1 Tax=Ambrosia artemisiifolia TaxID=4212 RepID=A0AAD5GFQ9_AMBAR|nr:hypothetical protein M8C21_030788 [Ambrosia artemisiifolia]